MAVAARTKLLVPSCARAVDLSPEGAGVGARRGVRRDHRAGRHGGTDRRARGGEWAPVLRIRTTGSAGPAVPRSLVGNPELGRGRLATGRDDAEMRNRCIPGDTDLRASLEAAAGVKRGARSIRPTPSLAKQDSDRSRGLHLTPATDVASKQDFSAIAPDRAGCGAEGDATGRGPCRGLGAARPDRRRDREQQPSAQSGESAKNHDLAYLCHPQSHRGRVARTECRLGGWTCNPLVTQPSLGPMVELAPTLAAWTSRPGWVSGVYTRMFASMGDCHAEDEDPFRREEALPPLREREASRRAREPQPHPREEVAEAQAPPRAAGGDREGGPQARQQAARAGRGR